MQLLRRGGACRNPSVGCKCPRTAAARTRPRTARPAAAAPAGPSSGPSSQRRRRLFSTSYRTQTAEVLIPADDMSAHESKNIVNDAMLKDIQKLLGSMYYEYAYWVQDAWVEGEIPKELDGTYFRNGPGLQVTNKRYTRHPFDGDGVVCSFAFRNGRAFFRNKFVQTKGFVDEQAAGRPLYRSAFTKGAADGSPLFNPFNLNMKNVANTGVLYWGGKLHALWENGLPYEMDPYTLETLGESTLGGQVTTKALGAHYRVVTQPDGTKRWVAFALNPGAVCSVTLYEFDESGSLQEKFDYVLPDTIVTIIHDIAVTDNYYIIVEGPVQFNLKRFMTEYLLSKCSVAECLTFDPVQQTRIHVVPRHRGQAGAAAARIITAPPFFSFHHANAYEVPQHQSLVVDTLAWAQVDFGGFNYDVMDEKVGKEYYKGGARTQLMRLVLDLKHNSSRMYSMARRTLEFPSIHWGLHTQPHTCIYAGGDAVDDDVYWAPLQCVCKLTVDPMAGVTAPLVYERDVKLDTWYAGDRRYVFEPLFIPRRQQAAGSNGSSSGSSAEDDGWLIGTMYDGAKSQGLLAIFDAQNISQGPVAKIHLPHHLSSGLHGSWCSEYFGPEEGSAVPVWRPPRPIRPL